MTWLDRKLEDFDNGKRRSLDIAEHAPTLFSAVWDRIKIIVEEASGKGFNMHPNGNSERRSLEYTSGPTYNPLFMRPEIITLSLSQNRHSLEVSGLKEGPLAFPIQPCQDNLVCLHFEGSLKTPEEVAQIIMGRFLFSS